ncbi:MAG: molybdopterin-binding protein [Chloroflexota bacterium]|nr:molybdopterin-binding protein [Chloroflexota bacterium]
MKFGELPIAEAIGAILAHKLYDSTGKLVFNKGHVLGESDLAALRSLGLERIIVTQLSDADLHEDIAAERIGKALAGPMVKWRTPGVGRANLTAAARGVLHVDVPKLELINNIYDGITIATLREYSLVGAGEMVALVKVVPFGVPGARVVDVERIAEASAAILRILPLLEKQVALIVTGPEARRERLLKSFHGPVLQRIRGWGSHLLEPTFVAHDVDAIAAAIRAQAGADLILVAGISAIIDREDIVPSALLRAGGSITLHGVPVDPGTLLMMGYLDEAPVVGAPGCVKSPKTNVIDWILPRLLTGERLTRANLVSMGHGGLLKDIAERPMPRSATDG